MTIKTYTEIKPMLDRVEFKLQPFIDELAQMATDLDALQAEDDLWTAPFTRLTDEQLEDIENERPGEHFSTHPYLY
jgi:hypothetical protein